MDSRKNSRLGGLRPLALTKSGFGNLRALAPRINSRFRKSKSIGSDKTPSFDV